ncbi:MAG: AAA family ATPase [Verrucomicrobia bacterium]|jgi:predicted ATPase|nr:AAA family ATPase [Verrucomicrobiota bacterium]
MPLKEDKINYTLCKYASRGQARVPVVLQGSQGSGKTTGARAFARQQGFAESEIIEVAGHRGVEACDLLGHLILSNGQTLWKDGAITEAFRSVGCSEPTELPGLVNRSHRNGAATFLLIDEIYRIPVREREIFLNALQPDVIHGVRCYKLRTGRALPWKDGAFREELIYSPCHLLSIVATSNVGMEFDVEEGCAAAKERFVVAYVQTDDASFREVVRSSLIERGFDPKLSAKFVKLHRALGNAKSDHTLNGALTLRTVVRAIENAFHPDDLGHTLFEIGQIWVEATETGAPLGEQLEVLETAIRAAGFTLESC